MERATIEHDLRFTGTTIQAELLLSSAHISGDLDLSARCEFSANAKVNLEGIDVSGDLTFGNDTIWGPDTELCLQNARVNKLNYPKESSAPKLCITGFAFSQLELVSRDGAPDSEAGNLYLAQCVHVN